MKKFWNIFRWVLLGYFVYAVIKSPDQAAEIVKTLFNLLAEAAKGILGVFDKILGRG